MMVFAKPIRRFSQAMRYMSKPHAAAVRATRQIWPKMTTNSKLALSITAEYEPLMKAVRKAFNIGTNDEGRITLADCAEVVKALRDVTGE